MNTELLLFAILFAILDWIAVACSWRKIEYFSKPGVMVIILAWLFLIGGTGQGIVWFWVGIFFSLAGDIFLMLPKEQFLAGLISFLIAHLAYILGFNQNIPPLNLATLVILIFIFILSSALYQRLSIALEDKGKQRLLIPVTIYLIVISSMLFSAFVTLIRVEWQELPSILVAFGALLFFISDSILAWNKFIHPLPRGKLITRICYHAGQFLLILGAVSHYL
jgi:uncharacterized membrane protein YhhN